MAIGVLAALTATLVWVVAHLLHMHRAPTKDRLAKMFQAFVATLPLALALAAVMLHQPEWRVALAGTEHPASAYGMAVLMHVLFFFCYVECFYHVERAVTLRMVIEIQRHPGGTPTVAQLASAYGVDDMIRRRLDDLKRNGFLKFDGERWHLTAKGRLFASVMRVSNAIFNSKPQNERLP